MLQLPCCALCSSSNTHANKWNTEQCNSLLGYAYSTVHVAGSPWLASGPLDFHHNAPIICLLWTVASGQLNIASAHTLKLSSFWSRSLCSGLWCRWRNGQEGGGLWGGGEKWSMSVYHYKLQLHVSWDSRGENPFSVFSSLPPLFLLLRSSSAVAYNDKPNSDSTSVCLKHRFGIQGQVQHRMSNQTHPDDTLWYCLAFSTGPHSPKRSRNSSGAVFVVP